MWGEEHQYHHLSLEAASEARTLQLQVKKGLHLPVHRHASGTSFNVSEDELCMCTFSNYGPNRRGQKPHTGMCFDESYHMCSGKRSGHLLKGMSLTGRCNLCVSPPP